MTQKEIVIHQLEENGKISRNWCLKNYISRLSSIIFILKKEGWEFRDYWLDGNFVYEVISKPDIKYFLGLEEETKNAFSQIKKPNKNQTNLFDAINKKV